MLYILKVNWVANSIPYLQGSILLELVVRVYGDQSMLKLYAVKTARERELINIQRTVNRH